MNLVITNKINLIEIMKSEGNEASYSKYDIVLVGHPSSKFSIEHVVHRFKVSELKSSIW